MEIKNEIEIIENKWLQSIFSYCKHEFSGNKILSHDHSHHFRVWNYVKMLLYNSKFLPDLQTNNFIEKLIFATFFHDTGMIKNLNENHGYDSYLVLRNYLENNNIKFNYSFNDVFEAIINHDNKNYNKTISNTISSNPTLFILSIADDLDALGAIGILRYFEIYYLRNTSYENIPFLISENVKKRYKNILINFKKYKIPLPNNMNFKYEYIQKFYTTFLNESQWRKEDYSGKMGIINFYEDICIKGSLGYEAYITEIRKKTNLLQLRFVDQLEKELNSF